MARSEIGSSMAGFSTRDSRFRALRDRPAARPHLSASCSTWALADLQEVVPFLSRDQVQTLLRELKAQGRVRSAGRTKGGRWYPSEIAE